MNDPAANSEVSPEDGIYFIVTSDGVLNPQRWSKQAIGLKSMAFYILSRKEWRCRLSPHAQKSARLKIDYTFAKCKERLRKSQRI
jgi:hypothetical protein